MDLLNVEKTSHGNWLQETNGKKDPLYILKPNNSPTHLSYYKLKAECF